MMPVRSDVRSKRVEVRMVELGDEHGRHAVQRGAALLGHGLQRRQRIETLAGKHHAGAVGHAARLPSTMPKQ